LDHQRSDSGVGSFSSDNESRTAYTDRAPAGADYDANLYSLLAAETTKKEQWMDKAERLDQLLIRAHKELKETQARLRGLEDHVEELNDEKTKLSKQNQTLMEKNQRLEEDLKEFKESKDAKRASRRKSNSPPSMTGANPAASTSPVDDKSKPRRSGSKRHSIGRERDDERLAIERERERISREMEKERRKDEEREKDKEMDRLRNRFTNRAGAGDESDANSSKTSSKSKSSSHRGGSYVEPLGQSAPRPQVQVPPSPSTRHGQYPPYPSSGYAPATDARYAPSSVPRVPVVHPQVVVSYSDTFHDQEDGLYHAHPLPRGQRSPDRRERR